MAWVIYLKPRPIDASKFFICMAKGGGEAGGVAESRVGVGAGGVKVGV